MTLFSGDTMVLASALPRHEPDFCYLIATQRSLVDSSRTSIWEEEAYSGGARVVGMLLKARDIKATICIGVRETDREQAMDAEASSSRNQ